MTVVAGVHRRDRRQFNAGDGIILHEPSHQRIIPAQRPAEGGGQRLRVCLAQLDRADIEVAARAGEVPLQVGSLERDIVGDPERVKAGAKDGIKWPDRLLKYARRIILKRGGDMLLHLIELGSPVIQHHQVTKARRGALGDNDLPLLVDPRRNQRDLGWEMLLHQVNEGVFGLLDGDQVIDGDELQHRRRHRVGNVAQSTHLLLYRRRDVRLQIVQNRECRVEILVGQNLLHEGALIVCPNPHRLPHDLDVDVMKCLGGTLHDGHTVKAHQQAHIAKPTLGADRLQTHRVGQPRALVHDPLERQVLPEQLGVDPELVQLIDDLAVDHLHHPAVTVVHQRFLLKEIARVTTRRDVGSLTDRLLHLLNGGITGIIERLHDIEPVPLPAPSAQLGLLQLALEDCLTLLKHLR